MTAGCPKSVLLRASGLGRASTYSSASVGQNGFTLIEIIVSLCIVAILA
ncbi:MAG: type II secretion system GspH family protein, partial [Puniceicoccales bacterium]|nr:type II secretion system GspH family protein [Puniceicoccales bacterium]